jgi:CRP/FNR family transcriptional regulator
VDARSRTVRVDSITPQTRLACATCAASELNLCHAISEAARSLPQGTSIELQQSIRIIPARQVICREQDLHDVVPVICEGWAASVITLSGRRRQILSILLPGDMVSTALLFDAPAECLVEAITDVRYRTFKRTELKASLFRHPDLFAEFSKAWIEEKVRANQLVVDLGRGTAEERIAGLIVDLKDRLARRGMVQSGTMEMDFPLRQHHIADATGLTPVHVCKVLSDFRRRGVFKISDRSLTILDPIKFRSIALTR